MCQLQEMKWSMNGYVISSLKFPITTIIVKNMYFITNDALYKILAKNKKDFTKRNLNSSERKIIINSCCWYPKISHQLTDLVTK